MGSANPIRVRLAPNWLCYGFYHAGWRIAVLIVRGSAVNLYQLRIINPRSKGRMNRIEIWSEAIRSYLEVSGCGLV
ncbi:MAG: hypothetical protein ACRD1O_01645 [Terriglobia bacterium]